MSIGAPDQKRRPDSLADDAEAGLWRDFKAQGSVKAREELFNLYLAAAQRTAARHFINRTRGDLELADLRQLAYAGLLEAIDGYDPAAGAPFWSYASKRVTGSIVDGLNKASELREQISLRHRMRKERAQSLASASSRAASDADALRELADLAVGLALGFMLEGSGLYTTGDEPEAMHPGGYESLAWKETIDRLSGEVSKLPEREQLIIRRHYVDGLAFEQIGDVLKLTKGRISQIHRAAIATLRRRLSNSGRPHFRSET